MLLLSAVFFPPIIYKCLLLKWFCFPFSPKTGPGESRWEDRALPWRQQEVGTPAR